MESIKNYFSQLNIFASAANSQEENEHRLYQQRTNIIATRVYCLLLLLMLLTLASITWFSTESVNIIVHHPTLDQVTLMPNDRLCSCSRISIPYQTFVSSKPVFHQVCSSMFVSDSWISSLFYGENSTHFIPFDIRNNGFALFQALASFCRLSKQRVHQSLSLFGSTSLISTFLVSNQEILGAQVEAVATSFQASAPNTFRSEIRLISSIVMSNHLINGLGTSIVPQSHFINFRDLPSNIEFWRQDYGSVDLLTPCFCTKTQPLTSDHCQQATGIYENQPNIQVFPDHPWTPANVSFNGLHTSCMPVDASLLSTLECLYEENCVNNIRNYLTNTEEVELNFTTLDKYANSRFNVSSKIHVLVDQFLVENWFIEESYEDYFHQCAPASCSYFTNVHGTFLDVLNSLIGLLGGISAGLAIVVPTLVKVIREKFWPPVSSRTTPTKTPAPTMSVKTRLLAQVIPMLKRTIIELNLFQMNSNDSVGEHLKRHQIIITRIYIFLLAFSIVFLTFYLAIPKQIYVASVTNPTVSQFLDLKSRYVSSLRCPCSNISIPFKVFLQVEPHYHQICSSDLLSREWLGLFDAFSSQYYTNVLDFSMNANSQFLMLASLCSYAKQTIVDSQKLFLNQTLVTSETISNTQFQSQMNFYFQNWKTTMVNNFRRTLQFIRTIHHGNHLAAARSNNVLDWNIPSAEVRLDSFMFYGQCNCLLSHSCRSPMRLYHTFSSYPIFIAEVPGLYMGCTRVDALLASTLECFYDQTCTTNITYHTFWWYSAANFKILNSTMNSPYETVGSIVDRLFVDQWENYSSFDNYFTFCAPTVCTYEYTAHRSIISLITEIIALFGGLTTALKILLFIVLRIVTKITTSRLSFIEIKRWVLVGVNNQQRLTGRLNTLLLTIILVSLYIAQANVPSTRTETILKPNLHTYQRLFDDYKENLKCSCSQISIEYSSFMNLSIGNQHEICSSHFITYDWFETLVLPTLQSRNSPMDFRTSAIGFFQLLASLCETTKQHIIDEISDILKRTVIHSFVVSFDQLHSEMRSIITQFQMDTSDSYMATLELVRSTMSDNQLISLFQTNWKWTDFLIDNPNSIGTILHAKPIIYNQTCSCGLSSKCIQEYSSLKGFMIGCYPIESLLKSSLECLYNDSCFPLIQSTSRYFSSLNISRPSRFPINSSVESILKDLMVEEWNSQILYERYYAACAPFSCDYFYIGSRSNVEIATSLLSLYGGLVIVVKLNIYILVSLGHQFKNRKRMRQVSMEPN